MLYNSTQAIHNWERITNHGYSQRTYKNKTIGTRIRLIFQILPPTGKNRCITKNFLYTFSNLGNGMCQMTLFSTLDIYGLIRYLRMLKNLIFSVVPFYRFWKMNKINSFLPTFSSFWQNKHLFILFKTLISL